MLAVPTGRIDFATQLDGNDDTQQSEFKLLVEEQRMVESIAGSENLEIQWRLATLKEAKAVANQYHKYLSEHSLIKSLMTPHCRLHKRLRAIRRTRISVGRSFTC